MMAEANSEGSKAPKYEKTPLFGEQDTSAAELSPKIIDPSTGREITPILLTPDEAREDREREQALLHGVPSIDQRREYIEAMGRDRKVPDTGFALEDKLREVDEGTGETILERADRIPGSGQELGLDLPTESVVARIKAAREDR